MNPKFKPSKEFFKYVRDEYSRTRYGYRGYKIEDYMQEKILAIAYGLTAWIGSVDGAKWLFSILGIEEVEPHFAFEYVYNSPTGPKKLKKESNLRIFRKIPKELPSPPAKGIETVLKVIYAEGWKTPDESTIVSVFNFFKAWIRTPQGTQWAKARFSAIENVENYHGISYRLQTTGGEIYWLDHGKISPEAKESQECDCCDYSYPCVDTYNGMGSMCNRCYAENIAEGGVLKYCNRFECKQIDCHNYLSDGKYMERMEDVSRLPVKWSSNG